MKKNVVFLVSIFIILGSAVSLFLIVFNSKEYQENKEIKDLKSHIDFYKEENKDRYLSYKKAHMHLSNKDIITQVNLNLDKDFYTNPVETLYKNTNYILINKFFYVTKNYVPNDLVEINNCTKGNIMLVKEAKNAYEEMCKAIKKDGLEIRAISAYRDYTYQMNLYNRYLVHDTKKNVDTYSARPGHSEHQSGLTVDIDNIDTNFNHFESTDSYLWMEQNAHKYGFILRYPKGKEKITGYSYEAWHYRYIGKDAASYIKKHNITFDEYYVQFIENKIIY